MSITQDGIDGEKLARKILQKIFGIYDIQQADWLFQKDNQWYAVEVKHKEMFTPPPFKGQGLNIAQVERRIRLYRDTGIRCLLLVIDKTTGEIFWQWLDQLENSKYFDTKNKVRIYDICSYHKITANAQNII